MATSTPAKKTTSKTPKAPARAKSLSIEPYSRAQIHLDALAIASRFESAQGGSADDVVKTAKKFIDVVFPDEVK